jgi:hypothetical protein
MFHAQLFIKQAYMKKNNLRSIFKYLKDAHFESIKVESYPTPKRVISMQFIEHQLKLVLFGINI